MSRATQKGTWFEGRVADFLEARLGTGYIERKAKTGAADEGDIAGVRLPDGGRVAVECKNRSTFKLAEWMAEARTEAQNYRAEIGVVVFKRPGVGAARMGDQFVLMGLEEFARLLGAHDGN